MYPIFARNDFEISSFMKCRMASAALSTALSDTLPMKPSHTITSALALKMSRPSTLPMKFSGASLRMRNASRVTSFPLVPSSPMLSSPTRGCPTPSTSRAYRCPMTANCTRCSGLQSMLAPTSSQTDGPLRFGTTAHRAGRSTPSRTPQIILTVVITAPVFPALTTPAARPGTARAGRQAGGGEASRPGRRCGRPNPVLDLADLYDYASLVEPAMTADPVRQLVLLAVGAFRKDRTSESVVGASLVAARARVTAFRIRHASVPSLCL